MKINRRTLIIGAASIIGILLISFAGWFWYISRAQQELETSAQGRGLGGFPVGSTYSNIVESIGEFFGVTSTGGDAETVRAPKLWLAATAPVAGITWANTETGDALRFMGTANGNVFDAYPETSTVVRRTNTLKPQIAEALWSWDDGVIARYLNGQVIESFSGTITEPDASATTSPLTTTDADALSAQGPGSLDGAELVRGILSLATKPDSETIFYIAPYQSGVAGYLANRDGSGASRIWTSSFFGWQTTWVKGHIFLVQNASSGVPGNAYDLFPDGTLVLRVGGVTGLTALENTKGAVLYSATSGNKLTLFIQDSRGNTTTLPFKTLAEKCTWSNADPAVIFCAVPHGIPADVSIPDAWYRGETNFSDSIWRFNTETGSVSLVYDPKTNDQSLDILKPAMSPDDAYLGFIDAATGRAWVLRTNN